MPKYTDVFLPDTLVVRSNLSPDQQVVTVLLQNLLLSFNEESSSAPPGRSLGNPLLSISRTANFYAPIEGTEERVSIQVRIRGHADLQPNARAVLVSRLAGATFVDELASCAAKTNGFDLIHTVTLSPKVGFLATLILLADRDMVEGKAPGALVSVETMELSFAAQPATKG